MSKIPTQIQTKEGWLRQLWFQLAQVVNYHIGFGDGVTADNIDGVWVAALTPVTPDTDFTLSHNLGRLPSGYWIMQKDAACDVYDGSIVATKNEITLKATVAGVTINLFII